MTTLGFHASHEQMSPRALLDAVVAAEAAGFRTAIRYIAPRKLRTASNPSHSDGRHGSIRKPSCSGRIPRIHWVIATKFHAAVPVSQEFFASPKLGASRPAIICA